MSPPRHSNRHIKDYSSSRISFGNRYEWVCFQELVKAKEEKERVEEGQRLHLQEMQRREEEKDKLLKVGDFNLLFDFISVDIADITQLRSEGGGDECHNLLVEPCL